MRSHFVLLRDELSVPLTVFITIRARNPRLRWSDGALKHSTDLHNDSVWVERSTLEQASESRTVWEVSAMRY